LVVEISQLTIRLYLLFKFSIRLDSNANKAMFGSWFIDCLCGFSTRIKQENVDSQNSGLHQNTSTEVIILNVCLNDLRCL